jgi:hypothetical protein
LNNYYNNINNGRLLAYGFGLDPVFLDDFDVLIYNFITHQGHDISWEFAGQQHMQVMSRETEKWLFLLSWLPMSFKRYYKHEIMRIQIFQLI